MLARAISTSFNLTTTPMEKFGRIITTKMCSAVQTHYSHFASHPKMESINANASVFQTVTHHIFLFLKH
jgi:hypothetical protein